MEQAEREKLAGEYARAIIHQLPSFFRTDLENWLIIEQGIKDQIVGAMILAETLTTGENDGSP